jgi:beta-phosphoglucomutase
VSKETDARIVVDPAVRPAPRPATHVRGVIFDLDGVIVSTDEFHYQAWQQMADAEGIPFDREINHRLRGVSRMQSLAIILERARRACTEEEKLALAERKNATYRALLDKLTPRDILPGALPLLDGLRGRGIRVAVASSSRNAGTILERIGLAGAFDAVVDGNAITHSKPHPEVFLKAAARLRLRPARCLVVEDAVAGVEAAHAAGMPCLAVGDAAGRIAAEAAAPDLLDADIDRLLAVRRAE